MKCFNRQFGETEYTEDHVYNFPGGLIGFEHLQKFILINDKDTEPFRWLLSIEDNDFCIPIFDPSLADPLYGESNAFDADGTVAVIASLKEPIEQSTVNLRSPLIFNTAERTGKQVILENDRYAIQQRFLTEPQLVTGE